LSETKIAVNARLFAAQQLTFTLSHMTRIGLFYGTQTGTAMSIADAITRAFNGNIAHVAELTSAVTPDDVAGFDALVIGTSTWGDGELPDTLQDWYVNFDQMDLSGKVVALFGLGDQVGYPTHFCSAMGTVYEKVVERGATVVGFTLREGYTFDESHALVDGYLCGLALDDVNQPQLTQDRIDNWVSFVWPYLSGETQIESENAA
jgi:flavodoxin I